MSVEIKLKAFEFLVQEFIGWSRDVDPGVNINQTFTKLKAIKLHFFASSVDADLNSDGLLTIFDNFHALPYGPVESDVYDSLPLAGAYRVTKDGLHIIGVDTNAYFQQIENLQESLRSSVQSLRKKNEDLVRMNAFDLVELSHRWNSWKTVFSVARRNNRFSMKIPVELIKSDSKFFKLNSGFI